MRKLANHPFYYLNNFACSSAAFDSKVCSLVSEKSFWACSISLMRGPWRGDPPLLSIGFFSRSHDSFNKRKPTSCKKQYLEYIEWSILKLKGVIERLFKVKQNNNSCQLTYGKTKIIWTYTCSCSSNFIGNWYLPLAVNMQNNKINKNSTACI